MTDLLDLLAVSRRNVDLLTSPTALLAAATEVGSFASSCGATRLVAASPQAERIVGAALLLLSQSERFEQTPSSVSSNVLVIDINIASGTAMAEAVRKIRDGGAGRVTGLVLHALYGAVGPAECGLDDLKVLDRSLVTCDL